VLCAGRAVPRGGRSGRSSHPSERIPASTRQPSSKIRIWSVSRTVRSVTARTRPLDEAPMELRLQDRRYRSPVPRTSSGSLLGRYPAWACAAQGGSRCGAA